jgi:molybdate transport system ATP-binding protein
MLSVQVRKALREFGLDIGFEVRPAETLVIIGPSGCGKTTTLNVIAGLVEPDEGRVTVNDRLLWDRSARVDVPAEQRRVGYVFQDFALFPHMTVGDNVAYGLRARKTPKASIPGKVDEALKLLGVEHLRDQKPGELSGGEKQRVALARAIACEAEILLLDEPLGSLDAQTRNHVRGELQRLLRLVKRIVIMVTHDYLDALTFGDQICVLDRGKVLQIGSRTELLRHPKSKFVAELTGVNFLEGAITGVSGEGLAEIAVNGMKLYAMANGGSVGETLVAFFPSDVSISREPPESSAMNVMRSTIKEIVDLGDKVRLTLNGSLLLCAEITAGSLERMRLAEGEEVYASVKATAIKTYR